MEQDLVEANKRHEQTIDAYQTLPYNGKKNCRPRKA